MHRGFQVGFVVIPLLIGLSCLFFALFTEYWTKLDYSRIKVFSNGKIDADAVETISSYLNTNSKYDVRNRKNYNLKTVYLEFPKYSSLFGECYEYQQIEILEPVKPKSSNNQIKKSVKREEECLSEQTCAHLDSVERNLCFCCLSNVFQSSADPFTSDLCCNLENKLCNKSSECSHDSNDKDSKKRRIHRYFYSSQFFDNQHNCLRSQFNLWLFIKNSLGINFDFLNMKNLPEKTDDTKNQTELVDKKQCLLNLLKLDNQPVRLFLLRLITFLSLALCILFTILCLITLLFVTCCYNLNEKKHKQMQNSFSYELTSEDDNESNSLSFTPSCCRCNCLLCPFVFFSFFSFFAFLFYLVGLVFYIYSYWYVRNGFLMYNSGFLPDYITQAYQYNSWLFDVQQFGISFYAFILGLLFYILSFIISSCITCRMQISPAWQQRYGDSYEVLKTHDTFVNNNNNASVHSLNKSKYKKLNYEKSAAATRNEDNRRGDYDGLSIGSDTRHPIPTRIKIPNLDMLNQ